VSFIVAHIKSSKLDLTVLLITAICAIGISIVGYLADPNNRSPRVAYLYPAIDGIQNVWISDTDAADNQVQLTFSKYGIFDFDVSTDGRWLAFAEKNSEFITTLRLLDIVNNHVIDLVDCIALNAYCTTPVFSPDGTKLAYQRSEQLDERYGVSRIWLVDMTNTNYETIPLIQDTQVVGHSPVWSADNNTLAFYSANTLDPGVLIYDFAPSDDVQLRFIPSTSGSMGTIAPNGKEIIFPEIVRRGGQIFTYLLTLRSEPNKL
jgi:Tol biopolymer transport system component